MQQDSVESFSKLIVWQKGHSLVLEVYRISGAFPLSEQFGLTSQLRRAVVSVTSNIAEGYRRQSVPERRQFFYIAAGSLEEVRCQLMIGRDLGYLNVDAYAKVSLLAAEVSRLLSSWIKKFSPSHDGPN